MCDCIMLCVNRLLTGEKDGYHVRIPGSHFVYQSHDVKFKDKEIVTSKPDFIWLCQQWSVSSSIFRKHGEGSCWIHHGSKWTFLWDDDCATETTPEIYNCPEILVIWQECPEIGFCCTVTCCSLLFYLRLCFLCTCLLDIWICLLSLCHIYLHLTVSGSSLTLGTLIISVSVLCVSVVCV